MHSVMQQDDDVSKFILTFVLYRGMQLLKYLTETVCTHCIIV